MKRYWTWARIREAARLCESKTELAKRFPGAIRRMQEEGRLDFGCGHMRPYIPARYWTEVRLTKTAAKFKTRIAFKRAWPGAYNAALKQGFLDKTCAHMSRLGSRYYRYVYEVRWDAFVYVGLTANIDQRFRDHAKKSPKSVRQLFRKKDKVVSVTRLLPHDRAAAKERALIKKYKKTPGLVLLNSHSGGGLGSLYRVWDTESAARVLRGRKLKDILATDYGAYQYAKSSDDRDYLFGLIDWERSRGPNSEKLAFTFERLLETCRGKTMADLKKEDQLIYWAVQRHPRRGEITSHMRRAKKMGDGGSQLYWTDEKLAEAVRGKLREEIPAGAYRRLCGHPEKLRFMATMRYRSETWRKKTLAKATAAGFKVR